MIRKEEELKARVEIRDILESHLRETYPKVAEEALSDMLDDIMAVVNSLDFVSEQDCNTCKENWEDKLANKDEELSEVLQERENLIEALERSVPKYENTNDIATSVLAKKLDVAMRQKNTLKRFVYDILEEL